MANELLRESAKAVQLKLADLDRLSFQIKAGSATLVAAVAAFDKPQSWWTVGLCSLIIAGFSLIDMRMKDAMYRLFQASREIESSIRNREPDVFRDPHGEIERIKIEWAWHSWPDYFAFYAVLLLIPLGIALRQAEVGEFARSVCRFVTS